MGTRKQSIRERKHSSKKFTSLLFFVEFFRARFDFFLVPTISICPWVSKNDTLVPGFQIRKFSGYYTVLIHRCPFTSVCLHTRDVYWLIPPICVIADRLAQLVEYRATVQEVVGSNPDRIKTINRRVRPVSQHLFLIIICGTLKNPWHCSSRAGSSRCHGLSD